jgi:hypothetical protein
MFTTSSVYWQLLSSTRMGFDMFLTRFDRFQPFCVFSHFLVYSLLEKYLSRVRKNANLCVLSSRIDSVLCLEYMHVCLLGSLFAS